ncbi:hypothetical protein BT96DRAFT_997165 [Gymnopus androsaceus JB14]|uniref:Uncharacterized protein n=1 Tax=Gymnopus androsaceus JB14 TaxID=1447944 RepID=A0A6A4HCE7_9AGAR|nr:hypothetical protein BT96DRAFT_997165 [Gymnopus androsaceus JB14]
MPSQFDYAYNPNWNTYHAQAERVYPQMVAPQSHPYPQQQLAHPGQSSPGPFRRRSESGSHAHAASPYARARVPTAASHHRGSHVDEPYPPDSIYSFAHPAALPDAQWILANSGHPFPALPPLQLEYLPRRPDILWLYLGTSFAEVLKQAPILDDPETMVFAHQGWKRTQWTLDYPGLRPVTHRMQVVVGNRHITRLEVAIEICIEIKRVMRGGKAQILNTRTTDQERGINPKWSLDRCDYKDVRLIALVFHGSSWIPVLAEECS